MSEYLEDRIDRLESLVKVLAQSAGFTECPVCDGQGFTRNYRHKVACLTCVELGWLKKSGKVGESDSE